MKTFKEYVLGENAVGETHISNILFSFVHGRIQWNDVIANIAEYLKIKHLSVNKLDEYLKDKISTWSDKQPSKIEINNVTKDIMNQKF